MPLSETPDLTKLETGLRRKLEWDGTTQTLKITTPLAPAEETAVAATVVWEQSQRALVEAARQSRADVQILKTPSERGLAFRVPQLAVRVHGELQLFDDPEVLDYPWDLPLYSAPPSQQEIGRIRATERLADGGLIDVDQGKGVVGFLPELTRDLDLVWCLTIGWCFVVPKTAWSEARGRSIPAAGCD